MEDFLIKSDKYDYSDIPGSVSWVRMAEITEGDSTDQKFYVKTQDRERYFLRIADRSVYDRKKNEFEYLKAIRCFGIPIPEPVSFGLCNQGKSLYLQTRWIYGTPGAARLVELSAYHQYYLGTDAGLCLKAVHSCPIPPRRDNWAARQHARCQLVQDSFSNWSSKHHLWQKLLDFVRRCLPMLKDRPQTLLHGDFTTENIILSDENSFRLIDFDHWQYGDPLMDLANLLTSIRQVSLPFAIGVLDCYFAFYIRDTEMQLLTCYAALDLLEQMMAAPNHSGYNSEQALEQARILLKDFHEFKKIDPSWYKRMRFSDKTIFLRPAEH